MLRIAVCDDDAVCLNETASLVEKWKTEYSEEVELLLFNDGDKLLKENHRRHIDIVFLDIIMPLFNGMDTAKELRGRDNSVKIIFLTSSPEFALESYEVKANGYILKPARYEKISDVLCDISNESEKEPEYIIVNTASEHKKIYLHSIEYAEAYNKGVFLYLSQKGIIKVSVPLYSFEKQLRNEKGFFKCHRSYIVNIQHVDHFNNTNIVLKSGNSVPISRGYSKDFEEIYFKNMFGKGGEE